MSGEKRREEMLTVLRQSAKPVSGAALARNFAVSRQVVVQDIALLRAQKQEIISTNKGYLLKSRREIKEYMEKLKSGKSKSLKDVTSDYHYHTVTAESEEVLDQIQEELQKRGFLAELRDYEPIDFWK